MEPPCIIPPDRGGGDRGAGDKYLMQTTNTCTTSIINNQIATTVGGCSGGVGGVGGASGVGGGGGGSVATGQTIERLSRPMAFDKVCVHFY